ncbi:MAG: DUF4926 domain-containing protein [Anaerovoracaceae bacterium]
MLHELDVVRLKKDRTDLGIKSTYEGTIVDVLGNGEAFTVEFFDELGETIMEGLYSEFSEEELEIVPMA